jgi:hypothetical protein
MARQLRLRKWVQAVREVRAGSLYWLEWGKYLLLNHPQAVAF